MSGDGRSNRIGKRHSMTAFSRGNAMKPLGRKFLHLAAGVAAAFPIVFTLLLSGHDAWSQTTRTIKIVVPYAPGDGPDLLARLLADQIGRAQGPTMVIENRPGAGTVIGTEAVLRAAPDGNTLLINTNAFVTSPHLRKVNYNPSTSFDPICQLVSTPALIVVNGASPYRTLSNLLDAARARPGDLTLASVGPGGALHVASEMLRRAAKVDMTYVPYLGSSPAINALMGAHVISVFTDYGSVAEQLKAGALRALATGSRMRIEALPDVPTVGEAGYKDYEVDLWAGIIAPAKTPKQAISQLADWFTAAMQVPEVKAKLVLQGLYPALSCGADFGALIRKQYDEYGRVFRELNIKAD
jgi:tripartite-type tricarboxylate transporter receptor subunit TctC